MNDFSHLARLEDGKEKAKKAKESVEALRELVSQHFELSKELEARQKKRMKYHEMLKQKKGVEEELERIKEEYFAQIKETDVQKRGFRLEKIIKQLFTLFDLDPKASFKIKGEQIDGAFIFDSTDYLFEAKWQSSPVGVSDLDSFNGKLERKLENTLGLFLSINGFSPNAVDISSKGRSLLILMDGNDIMAILDGRIDMKELLLRKRRHASHTGEIYLRIENIL